MSKKAVGSASIGFYGDTGCPRFFVADPMFGGSIGANPETFSRLLRHDALEWLGPTVDFTPHNVDTPKTALALMLLAQTWAEWALSELSMRAKELADIPTLVPFDCSG